MHDDKVQDEGEHMTYLEQDIADRVFGLVYYFSPRSNLVSLNILMIFPIYF